MNRFLIISAVIIFFAINFNEMVCAQSGSFPITVEGGRGLMHMQTARTYGMGSVVLGIKGFVMERETMVMDPSLKALKKRDSTSIFSIPLTFGLTDEIDLTAVLYGFHDARSWKFANDVTRGYGEPETGIGASRAGVKIRLPFSMDSRIQIAGKFGVLLDTSAKQLDGMNYRWTRKGTDVESSLYETFDISSFLSVHLEQGYVLSGTDIYDDQFVGSAGIELRIKDWLGVNVEINNRTFLGKSPQSALQAGSNPDLYFSDYGVPGTGNPAFLKDTESDFTEDFFIVSPSVVFRLNDNVSFDLGAHINIADQVEPKETFQIVGGLTFTTQIKSMIDSDGDGIKNNIDIEPLTPRGFPVDNHGRALDRDRDGVPDGADREQDTPLGAQINTSGVGIDSDADGVYNGLDMEPRTPKGCPVDKFGVALDDDRDGVPNGIDIEPLTPKGAVVDLAGISLDDDGDGIPNGIDMEADTPKGALVGKKGVSLDDDGDGVPNGLDEEQNTPKGLLVDKKGRALIKQEFSLLREGFIRLNKINYGTGGSTVPPESYHTLNEIVRLMKKYPTLNIQIEGHTDSVGDKALNLKLSRDRARNVLEYILLHNPELDRNRFRVVGFGSDKPIASNNTWEGRNTNRRVEFVVINQDNLVK